MTIPPTWTPAAVRKLGLTTDVATAGSILGIGRTKAYELAKTGEFPSRSSASAADTSSPPAPCSRSSVCSLFVS